MAEAAGLAVGVIALASLFTSCVELLDYFELGKNYDHDYELSCTKIKVLHGRLNIWGGGAGILSTGGIHPCLCDPSRRDIVHRSLGSLEHLLSDTESLRKKYALTPVHAWSSDSSKRRKLAYWPLNNIRRRTTWSIRDKAKFDQFIEHIDFFITNMEKATEAPQSRDILLAAVIRETMPTTDKASSKDLAVRKPNKAHPIQEWDSTYDEAEARGRSTSTGEYIDSKTRVYQQQGFRVEISECIQRNKGQSFAVQGVVGRVEGNVAVKGSQQDNSDGAPGVQGAISDTAYLAAMGLNRKGG